MNNIEFSKEFAFVLYKYFKDYYTDNSKNTGSPSNFVALMIKGTAIIKTRISTLKINEGDVFFIPKNELYRSYWYCDNNGDIEFLSLSAQNLPLNDNIRFPIQKINCSTYARTLLDCFFEDLTINCKTIGLFYSFLGEVLSGMERKITHHELIVEKALDYMYSNTDFQVKDIASYCDISEATLYNTFAKILNKTPIEIKQQILCEKAIKLLSTTHLSVEEISSHLQFSSSSYFRKILKKHTNKTPSMIRKENFM